MAERALDARSSIAFLRHRWPVLLVSGLAGAVLGVLYAVLVPLELTSTSLVLLPAAAQSPTGGGTDIETQVRLVQSRPVLEEAGRAIRPALSGSQVAKLVTADGATSQLIEIQASSERADQAQALSLAVAKAYVTAVTNSARSVTGATLGELREREGLLRQQVKALQDQIAATGRRKAPEDPGSPAGRRDAQLLAQLTVDQADASLQWEQIKKELAAGTAAGLASPAVIVQPAAPATGPGLLSYYLTCALAGAVLGAALGAVVLLIRVRRDPRLRTRDDIADAVGSTVLADVRSRPQRSVAAWSTLFQFYDAPAVDAWAFRQVLRALAASADEAGPRRLFAKRTPGRVEHPPSVTVVALAGDGRGLAVAAQLASFAASVGIVTRFVAADGQDNAPSLWAACSGDRASHPRPNLALDVRSENPVPGVSDLTLPPPPQTLDELLDGLLLSRSTESVDGRELQSRPAEGGDPMDVVDPAGAANGETGEDAAEDAAEDTADTAETDETDGGTLEQVEDDLEGRGRFRSDHETVAGAVSGPALEPAPTTVTSGHSVQMMPKHVLADLNVVLTVVDRREPTFHRIPPTAVTVLAISPGLATPEDLARLAVAVDDSGRRIDGIIVADADPADATTGRRSLTERALEPPLPMRTTGVSRLPLAGGARGNSG